MADRPQLQRVSVTAVDINSKNFAPFGQVIGPVDGNKTFDGEDAQLVLNKGTPRLHIMRLKRTGRAFTGISYHAQVTQCFGSLHPTGSWYLVVSPPTGSVEVHPTLDTIKAFRIPHGVFVKLNEGTWHAGPLIDQEFQDFYNLELTDTNESDFNSYSFRRMATQVVVED